MTLVAEIDGVALPDGALLITGGNINGINGLPTSAYYGEALTGGLQVDDPNGDLELEGLHVLTVDETACTGAERIWSGWISGRRVSRGPLPYRSGVSRVWDVDIIEANWAFALMVFRASSAKRPEETDLARAQFIIESAPMAFTPVVDNGRANFTDNPVNFDDSDLVTKYPIEAFNEFAGIAGKNFYAYWDHDEAELSLNYDLMGVGPTSTLAISNDIADTDSTTFYPFLDAQLNMTGAWTVTGVLLGYRGAYAYGIRQETIDELSPTVLSPSEFRRDEVYRTDRIGRAETANSNISAMLEARAEDQTSITVSIRVPASQVNLIEAGMLVSVKFTHLPGYETAQDVPVIRRTVVPTEGRVDMYDLHLELSSSVGISGPGGGDGGGFPWNNSPLLDIAVRSQSSTTSFALPELNTEGDELLLVAFVQKRPNHTITLPADWTERETVTSSGLGSGEKRWSLLERYVPTADAPYADVLTTSNAAGWGAAQIAMRANTPVQPTNSEVDFDFYGFGGSSEDEPTIAITYPSTPTPGNVLLAWVTPSGGISSSPDGFTPGFPEGYTLPAGWTELARITRSSNTSEGVIAWKLSNGTESGALTFGSLRHGASALTVFISEYDVVSSSQPPATGSFVRGEFVAFGDGATTSFQTNFPYTPGSLVVYVDGVQIINGLTEEDPTTGAFDLDFAPEGASGDTAAERVTATYQAGGGTG